MHKNPWFTLVLGAMVGLVLGYVLAERQQVPPAKSAPRPQTAAAAQQGLPEGHPPVNATTPGGGEVQRLAAQAAELEAMLARTPDDPRLMVALGNLYFDAGRWSDSRAWYERALQIDPRSAEAKATYCMALDWQGRYRDALAACHLVMA